MIIKTLCFLQKVRFILIFLIFGPFISAQTLSFTNDASTWGFIPEWDDFETNAFAIDYSWSKWYSQLQYRIFTDRNDSEDDSGRIDSLLMKSLYKFPVFSTDNLQIHMLSGLALQLFGDFRGFEIQGGWHKNVLVERGIPSVYEDSFSQIILPVELDISFPLDFNPFIQTSLAVGWPLELAGDVRGGIIIPSYILPMEFSLAYDYGLCETGSEVYNSSMDKQKGFNIHSALNFWPIKFERTLFFQENWGSGTMSINFSKPLSEPPKNILMHLNLVGFTHISIGVKVMKELLPGRIYTGIFYKSMNGWADAPYIFPEGGRFSLLELGLEEGMQLNFGPFRTDLYFILGSGVKQNQYYDVLESTVLSPLFVKNSMIIELGGGVRFFLPFFYKRKIGLGFEVSRSWEIFSSGDWSDSIVEDNPVNYILSLVVSS